MTKRVPIWLKEWLSCVVIIILLIVAVPAYFVGFLCACVRLGFAAGYADQVEADKFVHRWYFKSTPAESEK